ncbi:MAG: DUF4416 family protein [Desulfosudaceae bacterium]
MSKSPKGKQMSIPGPPDPAKLVVGMFTARTSLAAGIAAELTARFGPLDLVSDWFDFDYTDYYTREFGSPLFRRLFVFHDLIEQDELARVKQATNDIEQEHRQEGARLVNLDPGYLLRERFVLATGKNFAHRIYIGNQIYADLTLIYRHQDFQALPWTYPDYADLKIRRFLLLVRKRYLVDLAQAGSTAINNNQT